MSAGCAALFRFGSDAIVFDGGTGDRVDALWLHNLVVQEPVVKGNGRSGSNGTNNSRQALSLSPSLERVGTFDATRPATVPRDQYLDFGHGLSSVIFPGNTTAVPTARSTLEVLHVGVMCKEQDVSGGGTTFDRVLCDFILAAVDAINDKAGISTDFPRGCHLPPWGSLDRVGLPPS